MATSCSGATRCVRTCLQSRLLRAGALRIIIATHLAYPLHTQIEYLVVSFDNESKNAKLSLRQSEILAKLANIVDDLNETSDEK